MSVFVDKNFYYDVIPLWYRDLATSRADDINHFLFNTLKLSKVKINCIRNDNHAIIGWTIDFNPPSYESIFRLLYSEYIV